MIKEKELVEFKPVIKYPNAQGLNLDAILKKIRDEAHDNGVSVAFYSDEVKYAGLGAGKESCLVLYHPEHEKDYFKFCIRVRHQGNYAFVTVENFGVSVQIGNLNSKENVSQTLKYGSGSEKVGALIGGGIRTLLKGGANKQKLEEEQMWYAVVSDIFDKLIEI